MSLSRFSELQTGDIILVNNQSSSWVWSSFDWIIRSATSSPYSHVAMVVRDPTWLNPSLKGLYLWESSYNGTKDPQDGLVKVGVQLTPFHEFLDGFKGKIYWRKLEKGRHLITPKLLKTIHETVYMKPYDCRINDWYNAWSRKDSEPQKTDRFWCSALVAYFLVQFKFLDDKTDWSIIRPDDLSSGTQYLDFNRDICLYGPDTCIV